jgi:hypothetical protein
VSAQFARSDFVHAGSCKILHGSLRQIPLPLALFKAFGYLPEQDTLP